MRTGRFLRIVLGVPNGVRQLVDDILCCLVSTLLTTYAQHRPFTLADVDSYLLFVDGTWLASLHGAVRPYQSAVRQGEWCCVDFLFSSVDGVVNGGIRIGSRQCYYALAAADGDIRREGRCNSCSLCQLAVGKLFVKGNDDEGIVHLLRTNLILVDDVRTTTCIAECTLVDIEVHHRCLAEVHFVGMLLPVVAVVVDVLCPPVSC